jgi:5-methylcytosine-specific restriction protein A
MEISKGPTGRITGLRTVLSGVTRANVLRVLADFTLEAAGKHGFADSTDFDLVYEDRRFPPKAVLGLAAEASVGRVLLPDEFSGGKQSTCFSVLQSLGFAIERKTNADAVVAPATSGARSEEQITRGSIHAFQQGERYHRRDVFRHLGVPDPGGGPMYTGYAAHGDDWFIFCGVNSAGRTGHDYNNHFIGNDLLWHGKTRSSLGNPSIQALLNPRGHTYIFYREGDRDPFTFAGIGAPKKVRDATPVEVLWALRPCPPSQRLTETLPEEIPESATVIEGAKKSITVNAYERDRAARQRCIQRWGLSCVVCGFDFERTYGELGSGFIHVHHLRPLAEIGQEYTLDPIADLRPVCPNCHAMLHRGDVVLSVEELRNRLTK